MPLIEAGDGDELGRGAEGRPPGRLVVQAFPSIPNQNIRVVPDFRPFYIRPDIRFHLPDIRLEKLFKIKNSFDK